MFLTLLPLIGIVGNIALQVLGTTGVLSPTNTNLATALLGNVLPFLGTLSSGQGKTADILAALGLLSATLAVLKADLKLPADRLNQINLIDADIQKAIAAYALAGKGFDPSLYAPIGVIA